MKRLLVGLTVAGAALALASSAFAKAHTVFLTSAQEIDHFAQVNLPLYRGTSGGQTVWYVITDSSSKYWADTLGVNYAPRLAVAAPTTAVMPVTGYPTSLSFPATVDFSPQREFDIGQYGPDETGIPLAPTSAPGAVGESGYSPLVLLPDGTVLDASQVANSTGHADKAERIRTQGIVGSVTYDETAGFFDHHTVHYISLDGNVPPAAILEDVTWAPALSATPNDAADENTDPTTSARAGIIGFTNGQSGLGNPNRQGFRSTIFDAAAIGATGATGAPPPVPLNIIQAVPAGPNADLYSPLWDVHLTRWVPERVAYADRTRQTSFTDVQALAAAGDVSGPSGGPWGPSGPVANCPIISTDGPGDIVIPPPN